jgi:hypothetical protein
MTTFHHALRWTLAATTIAALAACGNMGASNSSGGMGSMAASASTTTFAATLSSSAEVPPNMSTGTGTLTATLDKASNVLTWKLSYSGLTGPATMAHFHGPAMPGANAGVVLPFQGAASPIEGSATLTAAQIADLMAGRWYANLHTAANPGGEIRGQLMAK